MVAKHFRRMRRYARRRISSLGLSKQSDETLGKVMLGIGRVRAGKRRIGRARIQCDERNGWSQWRLMALVGEAIDVSKALTGSFTGRARLRRIELFGMRREGAADSIATYSGIVLYIGVPY